MKSVAIALGAAFLLCACAGTTERPPAVERMYVIDCGENHVKDVSRWTPGLNAGIPHVFGNHCYLIRHAKGWMLWDSGNPDRLAALPKGLTNPQGTITAFMKKPLAESLKQLGVAPAQIQHFALSHYHGDHSGNANLFAASTHYMQAADHDVVFGKEPQKFGVAVANFEKLRGAKTVKLNGDHDVFGDGSVLIKSAPGHTPGHQVLVVRLPKSGPVMLSGDMVHLGYSWANRIVPSFNYDIAQSGRTIDAMKDYAQKTGTKLWINHDKEQHASIPKAPAFVE
ncbi:MAG: N-acyl homoserine lactonase family protein [Betaproteobacteria bacterium]